jgi:hypothetical protein
MVFFSLRASPTSVILKSRHAAKIREGGADKISSGFGLGTEFHSEKIPWNRLGTVFVIPWKKVLVPRHSKFRGRANSEARNMVQNGLPRVCFYFCSRGRNSQLFSLPRKGSEQNSESFLFLQNRGNSIGNTVTICSV